MKDIQVSNRVTAALRRAGINDRLTLSRLSSHQVSLIPGIGSKSRADLQKYLSIPENSALPNFNSELAEIDRLILRLHETKTAIIAASGGLQQRDDTLWSGKASIRRSDHHSDAAGSILV